MWVAVAISARSLAHLRVQRSGSRYKLRIRSSSPDHRFRQVGQIVQAMHNGRFVDVANRPAKLRRVKLVGKEWFMSGLVTSQNFLFLLLLLFSSFFQVFNSSASLRSAPLRSASLAHLQYRRLHHAKVPRNVHITDPGKLRLKRRCKVELRSSQTK